MGQRAVIHLCKPSTQTFPEDDPIRWGAQLGVRDTFLGGLGVFDFREHPRRLLSEHQRISSFWVPTCSNGCDRIGRAIERKTDERVFTTAVDTTFQNDDDVQAAYNSFSSYAFFLDAMISFRLVKGLFFEGQYFGYTEEVPFQGHTVGIRAGSTAIPQDTMQHLHGAFGRLVWRY